MARQISRTSKIGCGVIVVDAIGNERKTCGGRSNELAPGAVGHDAETRPPDKHAIANVEGITLARDDCACPRLTTDAWEVFRCCPIEVARAKRVIEWIDADGPHCHENFAIPKRRLGKINEAVLAVIAIGPVLNRFHRVALSVMKLLAKRAEDRYQTAAGLERIRRDRWR